MKKESLLPIAACVVGLLFLVVCGLVFLSKGNGKFLQWKLRIGALLIMLNSYSVSVACVTCYEGPIQDWITINEIDEESGDIIAAANQKTALTGQVTERVSETFAYRIQNPDGETIAATDIAALDGAYDEDEEAFEIDLQALPEGEYALEIFTKEADQLNEEESYPRQSYVLVVAPGEWPKAERILNIGRPR